MPLSVLLVDPDGDRAAAALRDAGLDVRERDDLVGARDALDRAVDAVVTEQDLPDGTGTELLDDVRETVPDAACFLYTDVPLDEVDTAALGATVAEYVPKNGDPAALAELVEHAASARTQTAYPLPDDEDERVDAVERLDDDADDLEAAMDRLTGIASALFGVPMTAVGLIDAHEQRFLACRGVTLGAVEREDTVCTHAILDEGPTVIPDLHEDPRFSDNEGLRDLGIRAYASANLTDGEGHAVGTFCVYDTEPRAFDDRERELLSMLAREASDQLRLRRRRREVADA